MSLYADIALPLAVDRTFTYQIPPELSHVARVGVRVIIPFGRKYVVGVIVALPESTSLSSLKPIHDVLDSSPVLSPELLQLCLWIAEYYLAPLGEVLKAAIPHGFARGKRFVHPAQSTPGMKLSPQREQILSLLRESGSLPAGDLQKKTGIKSINAVLNDLEREGFVRTEEMLPLPKSKPKIIHVLPLTGIHEDVLIQTRASLSPRKKKALALLDAILWLKQQRTEEVPVTDLLKKAGASTATLKEFVAAGVLSIVEREVSRQQEFGTEEQTLGIRLNEVQETVLGSISAGIGSGGHKTFLLHGVTGSGKTQVYIEAIRFCLQQDKSAIVLVPEIALTPQIVRRFKSHFGERVAVVHSRMSPSERHDVWRLALRGDYRVVIGPRSAVFAPLQHLGLIVVDEEHEASYKQFDSTPRYNARDCAIVRGSFCNAVVVLGSATPSAESYHNATSHKFQLLEMPDRIDHVPMPPIVIVNMAEERKREYGEIKESLPYEKRKALKEYQQSSISTLLKEKIEDRLDKGEGIILLQNRRGFAPFVECMDCGFSESCENCNVTMTYHLAKKHLRCHYCGLIRQSRAACPQCGGPNLQLRGIGTQRVEQELTSRFPQARILRMDLDTTSRKGAHDRILRKFAEGEADILLGTQMVAKGLDFARVTLVGVISADTQMLLPDFRSSERTFQLLTQVAGRAGRSTLQGEVIIQTHQPDHYSLKHVVTHDFHSFYAQELEARRELDYPPFSRLVLVETKGAVESSVQSAAERFAGSIRKATGSFTVLGPAPAVISKIKNQFRWHIIIKNPKTGDPSGAGLRSVLRKSWQLFHQKPQQNIKITIDVDPVGLL